MNTVSKVSFFVVNKFKTNPLVNTITFEKSSEIDYNKENIYPLVNVDLVSSTPGYTTTSLNLIITALQERDVKNELVDDKLFGTNLIDNLNECHQILEKFIKEIKFKHNEFDIDVISVSNIEFIKNYQGVTDGCKISVSLLIENEVGAC